MTDTIKEAKSARFASNEENPAETPNGCINNAPTSWTILEDPEEETDISMSMNEWSEVGESNVDLASDQDEENPENVRDGDYSSNVAYHIHEESDLDKHLRILEVLTWNQPYPSDPCELPNIGPNQFAIALCPEGYWEIYDCIKRMETYIHQERLENGMFSLGRWYAEFCATEASIPGDPWVIATNWLYDKEIPHTLMGTLSEEKCRWYGFEFPKPRKRITEVPKGFVPQ